MGSDPSRGSRALHTQTHSGGGGPSAAKACAWSGRRALCKLLTPGRARQAALATGKPSALLCAHRRACVRGDIVSENAGGARGKSHAAGGLEQSLECPLYLPPTSFTFRDACLGVETLLTVSRHVSIFHGALKLSA